MSVSRFPLPTSLSVLSIVVMSAGLSAEEAAGDALSLLAEQVRNKNTWTNKTIDEKKPCLLCCEQCGVGHCS
jgi:hypothetical protein